MATTTAERMRAWRGPAILTYGFRPFFFGAALWAALPMVLWVPMLSGRVSLPTAFDPVSWHAQEFLFGNLGAVVAGFLLTAVPNWTGRLPLVGWPLGGPAVLWLLGRLAVALSLALPPLFVALADLVFPLVLGAVILHEIVAGKNWRNLIVLAMLAVFALANAVFHLEAARGDYAAQGYGLRLGLGAGIMMIAVICVRIVPSFTVNWLAKRGPGCLPVPPMQTFDKLSLLALLDALLAWVAAPHQAASGLALLLAGLLHLVRLARWSGDRTLAEPLVMVLHIAYAFLPLRPHIFGAVARRAGPAHRGGGARALPAALTLGPVPEQCGVAANAAGLPDPCACHRAAQSVFLRGCAERPLRPCAAWSHATDAPSAPSGARALGWGAPAGQR